MPSLSFRSIILFLCCRFICELCIIMPSFKSCFKLCTFDVTNTLLKFKVSVGEQYAKVGRIYGVERDPEQITSAFLSQWKKMNSEYPNFGCNVGLTSQVWWKKIVEKSLTVEGKEMSKKQLDYIANHLYKIYRKNVCWEVVPGAVSLLKRLKNENIKLGVISNFDERLESVLIANDLHTHFDFILASYIVQVAKPNKRIFDLALEITNLSSSEAIHVGDNVTLDYEAARNAGWNAILIFDKSKNVLPETVNSNDIVKDIVELESYIFNS